MEMDTLESLFPEVVYISTRTCISMIDRLEKIDLDTLKQWCLKEEGSCAPHVR